MATQQQTKPAGSKPAQTPAKGGKAGKHSASGKANTGPTMFAFNKMNYQILAAGTAIIVIGFILMAGGHTTDPKVFDPNVIYSTRRVDVATIVVLLGFVVNIFAVMYKPKEAAKTDETNQPA